ncbi:Uncharacterized protein AC509_0479 [Pseudomonas amygdali pv. morsprunorum]|uniref:gp53-like domain-containing protein n=1 Tax=Pseudomonas amygdali TaxID=47877 RepID=UPI0006BA0C4A|nr:hypothetical protein [Pseudomonas amygdali]KPC50141.1 Uncharacterized protein AC509_0479 [Pseudomonas amygdali pv. morsprunorum]PPS23634.1 hypothetical protein BVY10_27295 [Pseudomonas amygdali pv. morsprunorum]
MPWLKSGTVSVTQNSNAVIGSNTAFISGGRVGDGFRGPDGNWYEVINISSDTALSIYPAYQGATVGAGIYMLAPLQGYVKEAADQLRTLVNKFGSLAAAASINALAAVTGGDNKLVYFTAPDAMATTDFPAQARVLLAANSQGAQRSALGLNSAAVAPILGTVSQSGGTPNGAILEVGSTTNGRYTKFASGMLIQEGSMPNITANNPFSGFYTSGTVTVGYPIPFSSKPRLLASTSVQTSSFSWASYPANGGASVGYLNMVSPAQNATATLDWIAIGRWFE